MAKNEKTTRFVIQKHSKAGDVHWDLMIKQAGVLATWRFDRCPEDMAGNTVAAEKIFDHELRFLSYNGPVNKGKGNVCIADSGLCDIHTLTDNEIAGVFGGQCVKGEFCLRKIHEQVWELEILNHK